MLGLEAEPALEGAEVVERLVDDRQADDRVDQVGADADAGQHAEQQRDRVADREQRHIDADVLQPVEEEDHAEQEQQVVVAGHHVLGAEVDERDQRSPDLLDVALVARGDAMRESRPAPVASATSKTPKAMTSGEVVVLRSEII